MLREKPTIERFGDRVWWLIQSCEPSPDPTERIQSFTDLWRKISDRGGFGISLRHWKRFVGPEKRVKVPHYIIQALLQTFPDMPQNVLVAPDFTDFEKHAESITKARKRWEDAVRYQAEHRDLLAKVGRRYHSPVDDDPEFPLIVQPGWILKKPIELLETSPLPYFDDFVTQPEARRLEGLNVDFVALRQSMMKGGRKQFNGDSYRVLDVQPKGGGLDLKFGRTTYFQIVNTCEAMAAELADFVRRNPDTVPRFLELRGPPEGIFDFRARSTYAVVSCLLMAKNYNFGTSRYPHQFFLHERDDNTLESQHMIAVVPAGGHQPCNCSP